MNFADAIIHNTVRIITESGSSSGSGTGFYFAFALQREQGIHVPAIVTNKHVIAGATKGTINITKRKPDGSGPDYGKLANIEIPNFESLWIKHPDPKIDLAVLPIAGLIELTRSNNESVYVEPLSWDAVANQEMLNELGVLESVVMVGYPNGLWDGKNNLPIVRRGSTATPPSIDFEGRREFVIDCACFPGSSGSPVVLFNDHGVTHKNGSIMFGPPRFALLGILYAGPMFNAQGELRVMPVPTSNHVSVQSRIPTNLGYCIKATELQWFEQYFQQHNV
jgi:Trypsin-like peptidase domain